MVLADDLDRLIGIVDAGGICMSSALANSKPGRSIRAAAQSTRPFHIGPAKNQWRVVQVAYLQQLPDHHRLEHRADAARCDDVSIGRQHELIQPCEEGLVREGLLDERIGFLLEAPWRAASTPRKSSATSTK